MSENKSNVRTKSPKKKHRKKKKLYFLGFLVFFLLVVAGILYTANYYMKQQHAQKAYEDLKEESAEISEETGEAAKPEETADEPGWRIENTINFEELQEHNQDVYCWIEIPGTEVDYPVLQHPTDDSYYLNHTIERVEGLPGSIYSELVHPKDFSAANTVLYGHNMKNDTMFGSLHDYEDAEKIKENPYIYIYLPEKTLVYEIFAAVRFSDAYLPVYCDYDDSVQFLEYVDDIKNSAGNVNEDIEITEDSRLLTLSTCINDAPNHRFLVEAVLIDEYER